VINRRNRARIQEEEEAGIKKERKKKAEREKIERKHGGARSIIQYASKIALISSKQCLNSTNSNPN
jgi:hypothetical protein